MANTYTQIHIHVIFSVKHRACTIKAEWKEDLFKYMTGIIQRNGHKLLAIGGMPDHVHIFIGMKPTQSLSDLLQDVKGDSSKWINANGFINSHFQWQEGFGAFSYAKSQTKAVIEYILKQEEHHKKMNFMDEYKAFLTKFEIEFDEKYIFKPID